MFNKKPITNDNQKEQTPKMTKLQSKEHKERLKNQFIDNPSSTHPAFQNLLQDYFKTIASGPTYICNCCNRFLYRATVVKFKMEKFKKSDPDRLAQYITDDLSHNEQWICKTCSKYIKRNEIPPQAIANRLELEPIPNQLSVLCPLEKQIITRIIPFMKIFALPKGGQHGLKGQVVLVPSNINKTADILPRSTSESQTIALSLKRRLTDEHSVTKQFISPQNVNNAFKYLKQLNPHYKDVLTNNNWAEISIQEDPEFWNIISKDLTSKEINTHNEKGTTSDLICEETLGKSLETESIIDSDDEIEDENPPHIRLENSLKRTINTATCLYPKEGPNINTNELLHIAPGEGKKPTNIYYEKNWEAMAFPTLFPLGTNTFNEQREKNITVKKYINANFFLKIHVLQKVQNTHFNVSIHFFCQDQQLIFIGLN